MIGFNGGSGVIMIALSEGQLMYLTGQDSRTVAPLLHSCAAQAVGCRYSGTAQSC
jgi:hypothetical protein